MQSLFSCVEHHRPCQADRPGVGRRPHPQEQPLPHQALAHRGRGRGCTPANEGKPAI